MDALKALSTQWDADQQQHVEELDILRARRDDLAQQVTDSAAQHEQHADLGATDRLTGSSTRRWEGQYAHITKDSRRSPAC